MAQLFNHRMSIPDNSVLNLQANNRMKEQEELKDAIGKLIKVIDENPCGMGRAMFWALAQFVKEAVKFFRRKRYLSTDEAAAMLGISPRTLRRRVQEGVIPPPRHYGHWEVSYRYEDIENYIISSNS